MKMFLRRLLLPLLLFLACLRVGAVQAVAGARLYLTPASGTHSTGEQFAVTVSVDTAGQEAMAVDALINFDSTRLEAKSVSKGDFFGGFDYNIDAASGRITIYSFSEQTLQTKSGTGVIGTITFAGKAEGTASVSFLCQAGGDTDSAVWDAAANDVIDCPSNGSGSYTIGSGSSPVATTAPATTSVPAATTAPDAPTSTPSQLPETGIDAPLLLLLSGGGLMLLLGTLLVF
ncbi:MAG: cohesin domain-containing protein [Patescibacteria group bacterium]